MRSAVDKAFPELPEETRERITDMLDAAAAGARDGMRDTCKAIVTEWEEKHALRDLPHWFSDVAEQMAEEMDSVGVVPGHGLDDGTDSC